ncbi:hypothetical protein LTR78_003154 [Recurvomyces mirabilis]|uniref:Uncharacterized protein n=1 Tax=Recurvomyces mirabilis TaxID=574656 RepID=A0AAE0WSD2_9PEZI|nr:hypothetical protein LTR78_003154 [Recurvomyces mirabilis]KAK5157026.1 hypothetical protein LTS14_004543 [Recurvomyces mirabilis]
MERSLSSSSGVHSVPERTDSASPPWESRSIAQVPYIDSKSQPLSETERRALGDLWATRSHSYSRHRPSTSDGRKQAAYACKTSDVDPYPSSAVAAPYESFTYIPPGPATAPPVQSLARVSTPDDFTGASPRPSETTSNTSSSFSATGSPLPHQMTHALPGTMASRSRTPSRTRVKPRTRARSATRRETPEQHVKLGKRFRTVFKDMFKRNVVDESQYEALKDRHWTEED